MNNEKIVQRIFENRKKYGWILPIIWEDYERRESLKPRHYVGEGEPSDFLSVTEDRKQPGRKLTISV